jgi:hypothetical protein
MARTVYERGFTTPAAWRSPYSAPASEEALVTRTFIVHSGVVGYIMKNKSD